MQCNLKFKANVQALIEMVARNRDDTLPSPAVLWNISIREREPRYLEPCEIIPIQSLQYTCKTCKTFSRIQKFANNKVKREWNDGNTWK